MKTAFAAFLAALTLATTAADAAEPIGGSFLSTVDTAANKTLITGSTNVNGLYLRTIATECAMNLTVNVVPPGTSAAPRAIVACSPGSGTIKGGGDTAQPAVCAGGVVGQAQHVDRLSVQPSHHLRPRRPVIRRRSSPEGGRCCGTSPRLSHEPAGCAQLPF